MKFLHNKEKFGRKEKAVYRRADMRNAWQMETQKGFGTNKGVQRKGRRKGEMHRAAKKGLLMLCMHPERRPNLGFPTHPAFYQLSVRSSSKKQ